MVKKLNGPSRKTYDALHMGPEPDMRVNPTRVNLAKAYNWYNYYYDSESAKQFAIDYLKSANFDKSKVKVLNQVNPNYFINSVGWNSRIMSLGGTLPDGYKERMFENIDKMLSTVKPVAAEKAESVAPSIQDYTKDKISAYIASIEDELDKNYDDPNYAFSMYDWLSKNEVKPMMASAIANHYIPLFNELIDVLGDGPADLKEGYKSKPKKVVRANLKFIEVIVNDAERFSSNVKKATKKPRVPKPKSAVQVVSKMKYKESDDKYKIKSIRPVDVVGGEHLIVFNTKNRYLSYYKASGPAGLSVKGTKILNYNEEESTSKKLRNPEEALVKALDVTKSKIDKMIASLTTKGKNPTGRINSDTVLLKVLK